MIRSQGRAEVSPAASCSLLCKRGAVVGDSLQPTQASCAERVSGQSASQCTAVRRAAFFEERVVRKKKDDQVDVGFGQDSGVNRGLRC